MWQPGARRGGADRAAAARPTVGVWRAVSAGRPVGGQAARPRRPHGDPGELADPRHFAYWRRAADVVPHGVVAATPGPARRRADRRSRRTTRASPLIRGLGGGRRQQRAVRGARAGPVRGRRARRGPLAGPQPARGPDGAGRAPRRLADAGPDHGRRRRRPPLAAARRAARRARRAGPGAAARRPGARRTCPDATRRRRARDRLGHARHRPGRRRPRLLPASARARSSSRCSTPTCSGCPRGWPPARRSRSAPG